MTRKFDCTEIEYLRTHFRTKSDRELAGDLNLSIQEVKNVLRQLGLVRSKADRRRLQNVPIAKKNSLSPDHSKFNRVLIVFSVTIICTLAFFVYWNSFGGTFHYDDDLVIVFNKGIKDIRNVPHFFKRPWDRPVLMASFAINYYFGRLNPWGYHLGNVIFHAINGILLFFVVLHLLRRLHSLEIRLRNYIPKIALTASLIHISHPVHTESVAYIASRSSVLATTFYLGAFLFFMKYASSRYETNVLSKKKLRLVQFGMYLGASIFYILGMMTKEFAVTLPAILLIYDYGFEFQGKKKSFWSLIKNNHIPFLTMIVMGFLLRLHYYGTLGNPHFYREKWANFLTELRVIVEYIRLLFIPLNLNFYKDFSLSYFVDSMVFFSFLILFGLFCLALWLWRFPWGRIISFCILWFFITLSPTSSFIPLQDVYTEHHLYLPGIGFAILVAMVLWKLSDFLDRKLTPKHGQVIFMSSLIVLSTVFSIATMKRNLIYKNPTTLWEDTVKKSPLAAKPHNNLGRSYRLINETDKALKEYKRAVELCPEYADALYNVGNCYLDKGMLDEAITYYKKTIAVDPKYYKAYNNLGLAYYRKKMFNEAIQSFKKAIEINPQYINGYNNLGITYSAQGKFNEAEEAFRNSLEIDKNYVTTYFYLGNCYAKMGKFDLAKHNWEHTLELEPSHKGAREALAGLKRQRNY